MTDLATIARKFIAAAFEELRKENAIPTSTTHRNLKADVDFNMMGLRTLPEYTALEAAVVSIAAEGLPGDDIIGPETYVLRAVDGMLELAIKDCAWAGSYDPDSEPVSNAISEFVGVVHGEPYHAVVARHVSHLDTESGREITIDDITFVPERQQDLLTRVRHEIPDADQVWDRRSRLAYSPPHGLLIVKETVSGLDYHGGGHGSRRLDDFLAALRFLKGTTASGNFEVTGADKQATASPALLHHLLSDHTVPLSRRTVRLTGNEGPALAAITKLVDDSYPPGEGLVFSSFGQAIKRFSNLDHTSDLFGQLVTLATALEGALIGENGGEGLTLRLLTRTTALLADENDPAETMFSELQILYGLRSKAVHGGQLTVSKLRKDLAKMPCVPQNLHEDQWLFQLACAVDRLNDIVRRALLARMCLASGSSPLWPIVGGEQVKVDALLTSDSIRTEWKAHWRNKLEAIGAGEAATRVTVPSYSLGPDDR